MTSDIRKSTLTWMSSYITFYVMNLLKSILQYTSLSPYSKCRFNWKSANKCVTSKYDKFGISLYVNIHMNSILTFDICFCLNVVLAWLWIRVRFDCFGSIVFGYTSRRFTCWTFDLSLCTFYINFSSIELVHVTE